MYSSFVGVKGGGIPHSFSCGWPLDGHKIMNPSGRRRRWAEAVMTVNLAVQGNTAICHRWPSMISSNLQEEKKNTRVEKEKEEEDMKMRDHHITSEILDDWVKGSIADIAKNIGEAAPFLVHIFSFKGRGGLRVERETALPESWPHITKRWKQGTSSGSPDGIILVKELKLKDDLKEEDEAGGNADGGCRRTWGLVAQGRGMDCAAACYVLSTCRVGLCTHFSLVRAKCFGEPLEMQLTKSWLVNGRE